MRPEARWCLKKRGGGCRGGFQRERESERKSEREREREWRQAGHISEEGEKGSRTRWME